jgi:hypothetical protein
MASNQVTENGSRAVRARPDAPWLRRFVLGAMGVAIALLASFYSIVASAVDRGERHAPAFGQSDVDEDLRAPALGVFAAGTTSPR